MNGLTCSGLPASWVNGWLAAVGGTFLSPELRLRWTTDGTPCAVLCAQEGDPVSLLVDSWPNREQLESMPIKRTWPDVEAMPRNVPVEAFAQRAEALRGQALAWTLSSTVTDLHVDDKGNVAHAPFDPPVPRGLVLHDRLLRVHLEPSVERIRKTLGGIGERIESNGLGFDIARMGSAADSASKWVDPVVETLAFFGLAVLPVRGQGTDARMGRRVRPSTIQRGWIRGRKPRERPWFAWPAWSEPLDYAAIDALLDIWNAEKKPTWARVGIHAAWRSVSYEAKSTSDTTRGYGSERL